jgi:hypothetical protein
MHRETVGELIELAGSLAPSHRALLERARSFGRAVGVEVLDVRPGIGEGVWDVRLRIAEAGAEDHEPCRREGAQEVEPPPLSPPARAEFASPAREIEPFEGDGTDDVLRFIAEADPRARLPARGGPARGATVRVVSTGERNRMLASTVVGDALLSLVHRGVADDEVAVEGALASARSLYLTQVAESGGDAAADDLNRLFDRAVVDLRIHLLSES